MGSQSSIDIAFYDSSPPKSRLTSLLENGFSFCIENHVEFISPYDNGDFNWIFEKNEEFDFNTFIEMHNDTNKVGISLSFRENIGGIFLIYEDHMNIILNINRVTLDGQDALTDFSWYLSKLNGFLKKSSIVNIKCEIAY